MYRKLKITFFKKRKKKKEWDWAQTQKKREWEFALKEWHSLITLCLVKLPKEQDLTIPMTPSPPWTYGNIPKTDLFFFSKNCLKSETWLSEGAWHILSHHAPEGVWINLSRNSPKSMQVTAANRRDRNTFILHSSRCSGLWVVTTRPGDLLCTDSVPRSTPSGETTLIEL